MISFVGKTIEILSDNLLREMINLLGLDDSPSPCLRKQACVEIWMI